MAKRRPTLKAAFLDSSVLFTAVNSPTGGSAKLFTLKHLKLVVSTLILTEVERNVREKLEDYHLERFFNLAEKLQIVSKTPTNSQIKQAEKVIVKKDAAILASAKLTGCDYLLTLDRKHFLNSRVKKFIKPIKIITPKDFLFN